MGLNTKNQIKSNLTKLDLYIVIPNKTKKSNNIKYMHTSLSNLGPLRSIILDDKKLLTQLDRYKETKYIIESRKRFSSTEFVSKTFRTFDSFSGMEKKAVSIYFCFGMISRVKRKYNSSILKK